MWFKKRCNLFSKYRNFLGNVYRRLLLETYIIATTKLEMCSKKERVEVVCKVHFLQFPNNILINWGIVNIY